MPGHDKRFARRGRARPTQFQTYERATVQATFTAQEETFRAGVLPAQFPGLTLLPSRNNQKTAAVQLIGPVRVSIEYSSPKVHGPDGKDRRGQVWGKLVPYHLSDQGFGNGKPGPWGAGAKENPVLEVSHDVAIEGEGSSKVSPSASKAIVPYLTSSVLI